MTVGGLVLERASSVLRELGSWVRWDSLVGDHVEIRERCEIAAAVSVLARDERDRSRRHGRDQHLVQLALVLGLDFVRVDLERRVLRESPAVRVVGERLSRADSPVGVGRFRVGQDIRLVKVGSRGFYLRQGSNNNSSGQTEFDLESGGGETLGGRTCLNGGWGDILIELLATARREGE